MQFIILAVYARDLFPHPCLVIEAPLLLKEQGTQLQSLGVFRAKRQQTLEGRVGSWGIPLLNKLTNFADMLHGVFIGASSQNLRPMPLADDLSGLI